MATQSSEKERMLKKCLKAPFRALIMARDFYVNGMMGCAGKFGNPTVAGPSLRGHVNTLPKSFSTSSSVMSGDDEYIRDLIRAASTKNLKDKLELEMLRAKVMGPKAKNDDDMVVPRSKSVVVFARIDENAPCDFGGDVKVNVIVPRSRSRAIPKSTRAGLM